ncbi:MAG: glycosyltransferase family 9 protein [Pseudomonadota bacterium]|nr:glycosyltransferase family 9 protein [Pseudomonadota bacterium]
MRCGAFGDMVLFTAMIRELHARFQSPVDILSSGPWSEPLLQGQPGVGQVWSVHSRKTPYWLSVDQQRVVRQLRARGLGPTWYCDANDAARSLLARAGIPEQCIVDVKNHPLLPGEHATEQWLRLAQVLPVDYAAAWPRANATVGTTAHPGAPSPPRSGAGAHLEVSVEQHRDLEMWLHRRGLNDAPLILMQIGNKRTMRRGLRRLAPNNKYWPNARWAEVLRHVRRERPEHTVALLGTGPEYALNAEVATLANIPQLYNVADDLPIPRLVALLARAAGLITVDSGPAHAAAAVGCPLVVLFGKALPSLYRPWGTAGADVKVLCGELGGQPAMLGIETRQVTQAWSALRLRSV